MSKLPSPPSIPSDFLFLLTYVGKQTVTQRTRVNASVARELGLDTECKTQADELG